MDTAVVVVDVVVVATDVDLNVPSLSLLLLSEPEFRPIRSSSLPSAGAWCEWWLMVFDM